MSSLLKSPVLILNKSWMPINVKTFEHLMSKVFGGKVRLIDDESFVPYTWEQWVENFSIKTFDEEEYGYKWINAVNIKIRLPEIAVLNKYDKMYTNGVRLSRKNLYIRDKFKCQYCDTYLTLSKSTIDHVNPKVNGGQKRWDNVVLACKECNTKKSGRTPEEAHMTLKRKPKAPRWNPLYNLVVPNHPSSWDKFINA
ncbi:MAG: HNH endonuclease [Elusimicrobiota bacterium]